MIPRFLHAPLAAEGERVELSESVSHHALRVLRLREGDEVELFDGEGGQQRASLCATPGQQGARRARGAAASAWVHCTEAPRTEAPPSLELHLVQCVSSAEKMDWTIEKAVELGVAGIQPLRSARSQVRLDEERAGRRHEHWQRLIVAACAQSGRSRLPRLEALTDLASFTTNRSPQRVRVVLDPQAKQALGEWGQGLAVHAARQAPRATLPPIEIICGPEAGLELAERDALVSAGAIALRMGSRVLRTETAGLAALASLQATTGDWSR